MRLRRLLKPPVPETLTRLSLAVWAVFNLLVVAGVTVTLVWLIRDTFIDPQMEMLDKLASLFAIPAALLTDQLANSISGAESALESVLSSQYPQNPLKRSISAYDPLKVNSIHICA